MRIFTVQRLVEMYDEQVEVPRFEGGAWQNFKYKRVFAGDQASNEGIFVPMSEVKAIGLAPWEVFKELKQHAA